MAERGPWEDYSAPATSTERGPWEEYKTPEKSTGYLADIGRAIITGPVKGLAKFLVGPGESEASVMNVAGTGDRLEGVPTQTDIDRNTPRAETLPGRLVENTLEIGANPVSWLGPGGLVTKGLSVLGSGAGGTVG